MSKDLSSSLSPYLALHVYDVNSGKLDAFF